MKMIKLGNNLYTKVDDNYEETRPTISWQYSSGYAKRQIQKKVDGKVTCKREYLHRLVVDAKDGEIVDHINGNKLDNKRSNLRLSNKVLNALNSEKCKSSTGFRNVTFSKQRGKYQGVFKYNKKSIHCGFFDKPESAFKAVKSKKLEVIQWV